MGFDPTSGVTRESLALSPSGNLETLRSDGRRPTWVLLPALGLPASLYAPLLDRLQGDRSARVVDLPGFGRSHVGGTRAPGFTEHLCAVSQLLEEIPGPVALIGHSLSSVLAVELARRRPDRVRALVLAGFGARDAGTWRRQLRLAARNPERLIHAAACLSSRGLPRERARLLEVTRRELAHARRRPAFESFLDDRGAHALRQGLRGLHVPVLLVSGAHDSLVDAEAARRSAEQLLDAQVERLARCGHLAPLERPEAFVQSVGELVGVRGVSSESPRSATPISVRLDDTA